MVVTSQKVMEGGSVMYSVMRNAKRIKKLRAESKRSVIEAAKALHIAESTYRMYENATRNPSDETKERIAKLYGTTVQAIFFEK